MAQTTIVTKIEVKQDDNISVKERIIRFFQKVHSRQDAEKLYNVAEILGREDGTQAFDNFIDKICAISGLDSNELSKEISEHSK